MLHSLSVAAFSQGLPQPAELVNNKSLKIKQTWSFIACYMAVCANALQTLSACKRERGTPPTASNFQLAPKSSQVLRKQSDKEQGGKYTPRSHITRQCWKN
jgi:hypothetical protein